MNAITISNVAIRQTSNNLYNLNDLHKASGGEKRHEITNWLKLQQTNELIAEISKPGISGLEENQPVIKVVKGGNNRGTFACKELVYAYATWISAKFFLLVIRTFDAVVSGSLKPRSQNHRRRTHAIAPSGIRPSRSARRRLFVRLQYGSPAFRRGGH